MKRATDALPCRMVVCGRAAPARTLRCGACDVCSTAPVQLPCAALARRLSLRPGRALRGVCTPGTSDRSHVLYTRALHPSSV